MTQMLQAQNCKFFTIPSSRNSQKRIEHKESQTKYRKMTRKPHGHVRILIYRTWAITTSVDLFSDFGVHFENQRFCLMPASFGVWGLLKKHKSKSKTNFYELWAFGDPFGFVGEIISCRTELDWVAFQASSSPKHNSKVSQYGTE